MLALQRDVFFIVSSEFATFPEDRGRLEFRVDDEPVGYVEGQIERLEARLKLEECCFLIPGDMRTSALLDICRCLARRAERRAVALGQAEAAPALAWWCISTA